MSESTENQVMGDTTDRDVVDGVKVIARQDAHVPVVDPATKQRVPRLTKTIHECLLEDGRTVFQCAQDYCNKWAVNPASVTSHARVHSPSAKLKAAEAELKTLKDRQDRSRQNRSNGQKQAQARKATAPATVDPRAELRRELLTLRGHVTSFAVTLTSDLDALVDQVEALIARVDALPVETVDAETRAMLELIKTIQKKS